MTSEMLSNPPSLSFIEKIINGGMNYVKYFHDKTSSTGTVNQSIKFLRWWCNCKFSTNINKNVELIHETTLVENVENGLDEILEGVKNMAGSFSDNVSALLEGDKTIIDVNTQTFLSSLIKLGVMLLFIGCVLYILAGIRKKITNYQTGSGVSDVSKTTSLIISKPQDFPSEGGGEIFFKQQKLQNNSLTVLTPIVTQNTAPKTPVNSKEMGKRPDSKEEKILRKAAAASPSKNNNNNDDEMIVAPIKCLSSGNNYFNNNNNNIHTDRTQHDATSPTRTDPTQNDISSPVRSDSTQGDASPVQTYRTHISSPTRTDPTQKSSPLTNGNTSSLSSRFQSEIRHNKT
uniref:Uncharacterized protein n=1 Tax=Panagrolaimus sp. PS1159 TaxID=55785 RepID=A0AC35FV71_9BILA